MKHVVNFVDGIAEVNGIQYSKWCYVAENLKKLTSKDWVMASKRKIFLQLDDEHQSTVEVVKHEVMCMLADIKKNGIEKYQTPGYSLLALVNEEDNYLLLVQSKV